MANKHKNKRAQKDSSRIAPIAFVLCLLALAVIGIWSMFESDSKRSTTDRSGAPSAPGQWTVLESRQHRFRVSLPVPARKLPQEESGDTGTDSTWEATSSTGLVVEVKASKCPEQVCEKAPDSVFKGLRESIVEGLGGSLVSEKHVEVPCPQGTCPGLEFESTGPLSFHSSVWAVISGGKVFHLVVSEPQGSTETFRKVVESFSFL